MFVCVYIIKNHTSILCALCNMHWLLFTEFATPVRIYILKF